MAVVLRPEARPISPSKLTRSQQDAVPRIVDTLKAATRHDKDVSRTFFLHGEAGTGKTTVYRSLREVLKSDEALTEKELQVLQVSKKALDELREQVVWLEPLNLGGGIDLSSNHLAAVLVRIDQVLKEKLGRRSGSYVGHDDDRELSGVLTDFQRLRADIGLAWDGNLPRRGEHLDPDVYAEEVMRAEEARIRINSRFHEVLENLTKKFYPGKRPIFVLPIDDISSNPGPSLDVLRLLHLVSTPFLFVLAMGDLEMLEELAFQRRLGQMIALAGSQEIKDDLQRRELIAKARQTAERERRKLLPSRQQARLEILYWSETLRLRHSPMAECTYNILLRSTLSKESFELGGKIVNLLDFLTRPGKSRVQLGEDEPEIDDAKADDDAYTAMGILEAPYRSALDFLIELDEVTVTIDASNKKTKESKKEGELKRMKGVIAWSIRQAHYSLSAQDYMSSEDLRKCEYSIRGPQYTTTKLNTKDLSLKVEYNFGSNRNIETVEIQKGVRYDCRLEARCHRRWRLGPKSQNGESEEGGFWRFMPPQPTNWFVLLHDLLIFTRGESLHGEPLTSQIWNDHRWAGTRWSPLYDGDSQSIFLPWPIPRWPSFWQFDSFLCAWNYVVRSAPEDSHSLDHLVYWWIRLSISVFLHEEEHRKFFKVKEDDNENWENFFGKRPDWKLLRRPLEDLCAESKGTSTSKLSHSLADAKRWLAHLCAMMAPEYSMPPDLVSSIFKIKDLVNLWKEPGAASYIRQIRAQSMIQFMTNRLAPKSSWQSLITPAEGKSKNYDDKEFIFEGKLHSFNKRAARRSWNPRHSDFRKVENHDKSLTSEKCAYHD